MLNLFDDRTPTLLAEVLDQTHNTLDGIGYRRFRADHATDLERLDELARKNLLNVDDVHDTFRVGFMGLYFVESATRDALFADINRILDLLREKYRQTSEQPVTLAVIADTLKLERSRVECCVDYIRKALTLAGTTDLQDPNAVAVPSEFLLKQGKFEELLDERARSWFPGLFKKERTVSTHGNVEVNAATREIILGAALWVINNDPKNCLHGDQLSGERIVEQIELNISRWWPDERTVPTHPTMVESINKYVQSK